jgi:hypothetical protein
MTISLHGLQTPSIFVEHVKIMLQLLDGFNSIKKSLLRKSDSVLLPDLIVASFRNILVIPKHCTTLQMLCMMHPGHWILISLQST